jgi:hypothetical protein
MNKNQEPLAWCKVNTNIFSLFPLLRFSRKPKEGWNHLYTKKQLDAAFALGVAQEREACANVLREAREALQFANDTPNGAITDTIWMMHRPETLFDFMDAAISARRKA